jgi:hypothetical protein
MEHNKSPTESIIHICIEEVQQYQSKDGISETFEYTMIEQPNLNDL